MTKTVILNPYPFGSAMPTRGWSDASRQYRYGFNGKEKDFETANDDYDFGARIYDGRLGRFLSLDPKYKEFPNSSLYQSCNDNPICFVDFYGEKPKIAIILVDPNSPYEFDDHVKALRANGYKIIKVNNGQQLIDELKKNSSPTSPIKNLTIISHGFPRGLIGGEGNNTGLYTDSYLRNQVDAIYKDELRDKYFSGVITEPTDPLFDQNAYDIAQQNYDNYINSPQYVLDLDAQIELYKIEHKCATISDLNTAILEGSITLSSKMNSIILGGCNTAGYYSYNEKDGTVNTDKNSFASQLADSIDKSVVGSCGDSSPVKDSSSKRCSDGAWLRHDENGNAKLVTKGKIDIIIQ